MPTLADGRDDAALHPPPLGHVPLLPSGDVPWPWVWRADGASGGLYGLHRPEARLRSATHDALSSCVSQSVASAPKSAPGDASHLVRMLSLLSPSHVLNLAGLDGSLVSAADLQTPADMPSIRLSSSGPVGSTSDQLDHPRVSTDSTSSRKPQGLCLHLYCYRTKHSRVEIVAYFQGRRLPWQEREVVGPSCCDHVPA